SDMAESPIDMLKRTAKADIIMDLSFEIKRNGPEKYITFNLRGLDAYTSKQIAGAAGQGAPSMSAGADLLLEEAVLSHMDGFNNLLQGHFEDMFAKGREVKVMVRVWNNWGETLETEFDDKELTEIIDDWFFDNTVEGRFSVSDATENFMRLEQVRIPMMRVDDRGRERAVDTRSFVNDLRKYLKSTYEIDSKVYLRGLGEAWLILGEK
ncbi:MAG TPA: DUF6175 family protein, partial [Tenuifilaceae bacterium]|nr:DUF6175 family protein [Tenuifilaceae bacterium]HRX69394.1 DUF6175 family protein [Tenuifilaceae bacterium]